METRKIAIKWWDNLSNVEKFYYTNEYSEYIGFEKTPESLTGREIEDIYNLYYSLINNAVEWWNNLPDNISDYLLKQYNEIEGYHRKNNDDLEDFHKLKILNNLKKHLK